MRERRDVGGEPLDLVRACEAHDSDQMMYERADLVSDLAGLDRECSSVVVHEGSAGAGAAPVAC